jgi:hypothetical protein
MPDIVLALDGVTDVVEPLELNQPNCRDKYA